MFYSLSGERGSEGKGEGTLQTSVLMNSNGKAILPSQILLEKRFCECHFLKFPHFGAFLVKTGPFLPLQNVNLTHIN